MNIKWKINLGLAKKKNNYITELLFKLQQQLATVDHMFT